MAVAVVVDPNIDKKRRSIMILLISLSFALVLQNYAECILIEYVFSPKLRTFVAAFGYSVRPAIIVLFIYMLAPERKNWWAWILVAINALMYFSAFYSHIVFYINETNNWVGGPLNDLCLIVSALLLAYQILVGAYEFNKVKKTGVVQLLFTFLVIIGIVLDVFKNFLIYHWVDYVTVAIVSCCVFYYMWLHFIFVRRYQNALLAEQRFNTMLSQIKPHFIYNSLSAIAEIDGVPEKAQKAIVGFSDYLRENLDAITASELVSFDKESEHVKKYIDLEKLRFGDKVKVVFDLRYTDFLLPALTVQMLVENAVKHGITKKYEGGTVTVSTEKDGSDIIVTVRDDGVGFDTEKTLSGSHIGLNNIRNRLEYSVGGTLDIVSEIGKGTVATITIPNGFNSPRTNHKENGR